MSLLIPVLTLAFVYGVVGQPCPDLKVLQRALPHDQTLWLINFIKTYGDSTNKDTRKYLWFMVEYERLRKAPAYMDNFYPDLGSKQLFVYPEVASNIEMGEKSLIFYALDLPEDSRYATLSNTAVRLVDAYGNHKMSDCLFNKFRDSSIEESTKYVGWKGNCKNHAPDSSECLQEELRKLRQEFYKCFAEPRSAVRLGGKYRIVNVQGCPDEERCGMELAVADAQTVPLVKLVSPRSTDPWDVRPFDLKGNYFLFRSLMTCDETPPGRLCKAPMTWLEDTSITNRPEELDSRLPKIYVNKNDPIIWELKPRGTGWQIINKWGCCGKHRSCQQELYWRSILNKYTKQESILVSITYQDKFYQDRNWMIVDDIGQCRANDSGKPCTACPRPMYGMCPQAFGSDLCQ